MAMMLRLTSVPPGRSRDSRLAVLATAAAVALANG